MCQSDPPVFQRAKLGIQDAQRVYPPSKDPLVAVYSGRSTPWHTAVHSTTDTSPSYALSGIHLACNQGESSGPGARSTLLDCRAPVRCGVPKAVTLKSVPSRLVHYTCEHRPWHVEGRRGSAVQSVPRGRAERPPVQILVVVAAIQSGDALCTVVEDWSGEGFFVNSD